MYGFGALVGSVFYARSDEQSHFVRPRIEVERHSILAPDEDEWNKVEPDGNVHDSKHPVRVVHQPFLHATGFDADEFW